MHQVAADRSPNALAELDVDRALAASLAAGPHPRGPLRPQQLVSVRQRHDRRLAAHRFRAVDTVVLVVTALFALGRVHAGPLLDAALADVLGVAAGVAALWWFVRTMQLYRFGRRDRPFGHLGKVGVATGLAAALAAAVSWAVSAAETTTAAAVGIVGCCGLALVLTHAVWLGFVDRWRARGLLTANVVIVGATRHAEDLVDGALERRDIHVLGIFDDRAERSPGSIHGVPVLGTTETLLQHRVLPFVDLIVVAIDPSAAARVRQVVDRLAVLPNPVTLLVDGAGAGRRAAAIDQLTDATLAPLRAPVDASRQAYAKRVQDLTIGLPLVALLSPVLALIALAIRLDSPGPVFFRQRRHGFNNEEIVVWKFRTMRHAAADATAAQQVTAGDDRVTRVGRLLRRTGLDEFPQLFNVISGTMSLVGPRPHAIGMRTGDAEAAQLVAEYAHRHRIKPGMTGWAAIHGSRGPVNTAEEMADRVAYDVAYIERQSLWLDLLIMAKTVPTMLGDRLAVR